MINKRFNWQIPISWQRGLLVAFIVAVATHYFWRTTAAIDSGAIELGPPPLVTHFEGLDYESIESAFAELRFNNHNLVLDANTESQFSLVLEQLPDGFENTHLDRISFLMQQQFATREGEQILSLLQKMAVYKKRETGWWERNAAAQAAGEQIENHDRLFELQDQLLGEAVAQALYGEQRRIMRHMAATRAIHEDESLSEQQKQDALDALANDLEQSPQPLQK